MTTWAFWKDVIETASATLVALLALAGIWWALFKRNFDAVVLGALKRERAQFRDDLRDVYLKPEIEMISDMNIRGRRTHEVVERHVIDFNILAAEIKPRLGEMAVINHSIQSLDKTMTEVRKVLEGVLERDSERQIEMAEIRGERKQQDHRRRT